MCEYFFWQTKNDQRIMWTQKTRVWLMFQAHDILKHKKAPSEDVFHGQMWIFYEALETFFKALKI